MKFSLVIPVYNEAEVIVPTLTLLAETFERELPGQWEMLVVDNASTDDTTEYVATMENPNITVISLLEKGKGRALRAGFAKAQGEVVGFTDADLPISPEEIIAAFLRLTESSETVLIGSRFHSGSTMPGREWWRVSSSHVFNFLARAMLSISTSDTQCPLKLVKRDKVGVFLATREDTWFVDLEFIALLDALYLPYIEIPIVWNEHRYPLRRSKLSTTRDGVRGVIAMLRIKNCLPAQLAQFRQKP